MQTKSIVLKEFSSVAIKSLNSLLSSEEDYKLICEIVEMSPVSIQNPLKELSLRVHSAEELEEIKIEVARIMEQLNYRPGNFTRRRQKLKIKQSTFSRNHKGLR